MFYSLRPTGCTCFSWCCLFSSLLWPSNAIYRDPAQHPGVGIDFSPSAQIAAQHLNRQGEGKALTMANDNPIPRPQPTPGEIRAAGLFMPAALLSGRFLEAADPAVPRCSFKAIYTASRIARDVRSPRLYDFAEQARSEVAISKGPSLAATVHPHFEAQFIAPLAIRSYPGASVVWGAMNIIPWKLFAYLARSFALVPQQTFPHMLLWLLIFSLLADVV